MNPIFDAMTAAVTTGTGGYEKLEIRKVPTPQIKPGEVLVKVLAAAINNTDINTRLGWYASEVGESTEQLSVNIDSINHDIQQASGWNSETQFPLIQGADCCGVVIKAANKDTQSLVGKRVLIRPCTTIKNQYGDNSSVWMGSDFNGSFANFLSISASEAFQISSNLTNEELASIPCTFGTAENMLTRARVTDKHHLLITGGSGGVGRALIQLAKVRGAKVTAISSGEKCHLVKAFGCEEVFDRTAPDSIFLEHIKKAENSFDIILDTVGGMLFPKVFSTIRSGGQYISSGAIGGPVVNLDLRQLYLKDITAIGCTSWMRNTFQKIIKLIETSQIVPTIHKSFRLTDIVQAQKMFVEQKPFGKIILMPTE